MLIYIVWNQPTKVYLFIYLRFLFFLNIFTSNSNFSKIPKIFLGTISYSCCSFHHFFPNLYINLSNRLISLIFLFIGIYQIQYDETNIYSHCLLKKIFLSVLKIFGFQLCLLVMVISMVLSGVWIINWQLFVELQVNISLPLFYNSIFWSLLFNKGLICELIFQTFILFWNPSVMIPYFSCHCKLKAKFHKILFWTLFVKLITLSKKL